MTGRRATGTLAALLVVLVVLVLTGCGTAGRSGATATLSSTCTLPALASIPPPPTPPPSPTGSPPPTFTAIIVVTPVSSPTIGTPRPGAFAPPTVPFIPTPSTAVKGTITLTATVGSPPATPTATRVGVPQRRQFVSSIFSGTPGVPALTPVGMSASPDLPAFTQADVCIYVRTHAPHSFKITTDAAPDYRVTAITLTTLDQLNQQFGAETQASPETLVYMVEMAGQFTMSGGPPPGFSNTYPNYMEVFDAHTGRLIIEGGFAR